MICILYHIHPHFARAKITVRSRFGKLYVKPLLCPSISIRLAGQRVEKIFFAPLAVQISKLFKFGNLFD